MTKIHFFVMGFSQIGKLHCIMWCKMWILASLQTRTRCLEIWSVKMWPVCELWADRWVEGEGKREYRGRYLWSKKKKDKICFVIYIAAKKKNCYFIFMMWLWSKFFINGPLITTSSPILETVDDEHLFKIPWESIATLSSQPKCFQCCLKRISRYSRYKNVWAYRHVPVGIGAVLRIYLEEGTYHDDDVFCLFLLGGCWDGLALMIGGRRSVLGSSRWK